MAGSPRYKVFGPTGNYLASAKQPELAACCVALLGEGSKIRDGRDLKIVLWHEGHEDVPASESYDAVAERCYERQNPRWES